MKFSITIDTHARKPDGVLTRINGMQRDRVKRLKIEVDDAILIQRGHHRHTRCIARLKSLNNNLTGYRLNTDSMNAVDCSAYRTIEAERSSTVQYLHKYRRESVGNECSLRRHAPFENYATANRNRYICGTAERTYFRIRSAKKWPVRQN